MRRERKITIDQPHTGMILFYQLIEKSGEVGTVRALEIAEFFQRNCSLRIAANVHRFRQTLSRDRFICGDGQSMRLHCLTEQPAASERGQCGRTNNDKRQIPLHKNDTSVRSFSAQSNSSNLVKMEYDLRITRIGQIEWRIEAVCSH